jgi:hypothetical protein
MILTTFTLRRYNYELQTSEMFSTAGRTVKSGLVASAVVSSWTWAATLLQSSGVAYNYGVSGPFWYGDTCKDVQLLVTDANPHKGMPLVPLFRSFSSQPLLLSSSAALPMLTPSSR